MSPSDEALVRRASEVHRQVTLTPEGYVVAGESSPRLRVTSITDAVGSKAALIQWAANLAAESGDRFAHRKVSKTATGIGGEFHSLAEWWALRRMTPDTWARGGYRAIEERPVVSHAAEMLFASFVHWARDARYEPIVMERRLYHPDYPYAGTYDLIARAEGRLCIPDYKTSAKGVLYESHVLQSSAYRKAAEALGMPRMAGLIVLVPKNGTSVRAEWLDRFPLEPTFQAFLGCMNAVLWGRDVFHGVGRVQDEETEAAQAVAEQAVRQMNLEEQ